MSTRHPADDPDRLAHLEDDPAFAADRAALQPLLARYRDETFSRIESDPRARAALHREIVRLAVEEAEREALEATWTRRVRAALADYAHTWRELVAHSPAFRWTSQGALALGAGLLLALILDLRSGSELRAADRELEPLAPTPPATFLLPLDDEFDGRDVLRLRDARPDARPGERTPVVPR